MKESELNSLLEQINTLVDNAGSMPEHDVHACASEIQRLAANLPRLRRTAISGWESARQLAVAFDARATERAAVRALADLVDEQSGSVAGTT